MSVTHVIVVEVTVDTAQTRLSIKTLVPGVTVSKLVPVKVTVVPPVTVPNRGLIDLRVGVIVPSKVTGVRGVATP